MTLRHLREEGKVLFYLVHLIDLINLINPIHLFSGIAVATGPGYPKIYLRYLPNHHLIHLTNLIHSSHGILPMRDPGYQRFLVFLPGPNSTIPDLCTVGLKDPGDRMVHHQTMAVAL